MFSSSSDGTGDLRRLEEQPGLQVPSALYLLGRPFDVAPDGDRLLMIKPDPSTTPGHEMELSSFRVDRKG